MVTKKTMITVIIPTYKPGYYLFECLKSLESQTLIKDCFQVLIVLNGEKEPYFERISSFISKLNISSRLVYSHIKGVSNARNLALDQCTNGYVTFIDDDDLVSPNYLKALLNSITHCAADSIACSDVRTIDSNGIIGVDYISRIYASKIEQNNIFANRSFLSSSCCKLIPYELIANNRFDIDISVGEDSLFMYSLSSRIRTVIKADESCIYYRRLRPYSASRSKKNFKSEICRKLTLIGKYTKLYLKNITQNNVALYLSRVIATVIN